MVVRGIGGQVLARRGDREVLRSGYAVKQGWSAQHSRTG